MILLFNNRICIERKVARWLEFCQFFGVFHLTKNLEISEMETIGTKIS